MKISTSTKERPKNKVFRPLQTLWARVLEIYYRERLAFILGLSAERFAYAEFYVNGMLHPLKAENFDQLERIVDLQCNRLHFKKVSSFMLAQMWASRKLIKFQSHSAKLEVLTYWHF